MIACPCCGLDNCHPGVRAIAELLIANGYTVTSVCRCRSRNDAVGGVPRSKHLIGKAIDIYLPSKYSDFKF